MGQSSNNMTLKEIKEQISFYKKEWLKSNILLLSLSLILIVGFVVAGIFLREKMIGMVLLVSSPVLTAILYAYVHNKMMSYVESQVFDKQIRRRAY
jgi:uncharacterized membrane protein YesL